MTVYSIIQRQSPRPNDQQNRLGWIPPTATVTEKQGFTLVELPEGVSLPVGPPDALIIQGYPALDQVGALATLLVVEGAVSLADAANIAKKDPDHLVAEAEAWAAAEAGVRPTVVQRGRRTRPTA